MSNLNTALFLDFDHTLFDTDEFFHVDIRNVFHGFGLEDSAWERTYERVWKGGYTLERHMEEICHDFSGQLSPEEIRHIVNEAFSDLRRYLFSDVLSFLIHTRESGVRLFLLSFGNPAWQSYKVSATQIGSYFDDMFFIPEEGGKAKIICEFVNRFDRVVMVDNNPEELDLIKDAAPGVVSYCINRVPDSMVIPDDDLTRVRFLDARRYLGKIWRHRHIACKNLSGILFS